MSKISRVASKVGLKTRGPREKRGVFMQSALIATGLIFFMIVIILTSLGVGLYYLLRHEGKSDKVALALKWRIILSLVLFGALFLAFAMGCITPHPLS